MCYIELAVKEREMLDTLQANGEKTPAGAKPTSLDDGLAVDEGPSEDISNWIPQFVQSAYEDTDGVQHAALIVALTGGVASADASKIEVTATDNCHAMLVSEEWCEEMTDMDLFYKNVDISEDKIANDMCMRQFATMKAVRDIGENFDLFSAHPCCSKPIQLP